MSDVLRAGNTELVEDAFLVLGRRKTTWAQLTEGRLQVRATTYQWLYLRRVGAYDIEPRLWPVGETTKVTFTAWDGPTGDAVEIDAGPGVTITNPRAIGRGAVRVVADVRVAAGAATGPRDVRIAVDGVDAASARGGAWVVDSLPAAGDCESALDEEVADGAWFATLDGLVSGAFDASSCDIGDPGGPEQAIPVELAAGQTLTARLITDAFGATMYIARGCGEPAATACSDFPTFSFGADLSYTATTAETVLLVVDSFPAEPGRARYAVDIRRSEPVEIVVSPDWVAAGTSATVVVTGIGDGFVEETAAVAFGDGVEVRSLVLDDDTALVGIEVADDAGGTRSITATLGGGEVVRQGALSIRSRLPQPTCQAATQAEPIGTGIYVGSSASGNSDLRVPDLCPDATVGEEVVHRVDLQPGQTLQALVTGVAFDAVLYLLTDCDEQAVACSDFGRGPVTEFLEWTAPSEAISVYLVVDGLDEFDQGDYTLHVRVLE